LAESGAGASEARIFKDDVVMFTGWVALVAVFLSEVVPVSGFAQRGLDQWGRAGVVFFAVLFAILMEVDRRGRGDAEEPSEA